MMTTHVETLFNAPGPQPNGMQATADGIWMLDQVTNHVHLVSYGGEVLRTLETASNKGSGITDDGEVLWVTSTYSREVLKLDRNSGATLATFPSPDPSETGAHGLEWHGGHLWIANPPSATVYKVDVSDGFEIVHSFPAPGNRPHGIAWNGDDLWCVETNLRGIFHLDARDGTILDSIEIPEPLPEPHGMTLWAGYFWYCDAHDGAVCRLPLDQD